MIEHNRAREANLVKGLVKEHDDGSWSTLHRKHKNEYRAIMNRNMGKERPHDNRSQSPNNRELLTETLWRHFFDRPCQKNNVAERVATVCITRPEAVGHCRPFIPGLHSIYISVLAFHRIEFALEMKLPHGNSNTILLCR